MAEDTTSGIVQIKKRTAALSHLGTTDLSDAQKMSALIQTAKEVNEQSKALKEQDTLVKDEFKRICKPYTDKGQGVTCYDYETEMKMTVSVQSGSMELDEKTFLEKLYAHYGEQVGDKGGKAWRAYCEISDPMDAPRKLNPDKLAYQLSKSERIASGMEAGEVLVTAAMVNESTTEKPAVIKAQCSKMTKGEIKSHQLGELTEVMVVK